MNLHPHLPGAPLGAGSVAGVTQQKLPSAPPLIEQKLTKAGYTRGATPSEIFQNRVTRNNTVLIDLGSLTRFPGHLP